jgi:hypothetical protein
MTCALAVLPSRGFTMTIGAPAAMLWKVASLPPSLLTLIVQVFSLKTCPPKSVPRTVTGTMTARRALRRPTTRGISDPSGLGCVSIAADYGGLQLPSQRTCHSTKTRISVFKFRA